APDSRDAEVYALNDLDLASRLSFFLWSQPPDDELRNLAVAGELRNPSVMDAQVTRMLADPRAQALVSSFALKWLNLDDPDAVQPDPAIFRQFNAALSAEFDEEI